MRKDLQTISFFSALSLVFLAFPDLAHAVGTSSGLPWETPLQKIASSLQGPVAGAIALMAITACGISMMVFEVGKSIRWLLTIVCGFSVITLGTGVLTLLGLNIASF